MKLEEISRDYKTKIMSIMLHCYQVMQSCPKGTSKCGDNMSGRLEGGQINGTNRIEKEGESIIELGERFALNPTFNTSTVFFLWLISNFYSTLAQSSTLYVEQP